MCPACQYIYSFSAIENFFSVPKSAKEESDQQKQRDLFMRAKPSIQPILPATIDENAVSFKELNRSEFELICKHLEIENIAPLAFEDLGMLCNVNEKILYFPMQDVDNQIIGYKKLYKCNERILEETYPESNSFGAVIVPSVKRLSKDHNKLAILVLNMVDVLALRMQKTNGNFSFFFFFIFELAINLLCPLFISNDCLSSVRI